MAIKGKSKSRSARAVTRGPRPVYQPVKQPLLARRAFWLWVGGILVVAALIGVAIAIVIDRGEDQQRQLADVVERYGRELDPILGTVGQAESVASFSAFTDLDTVLQELGSANPKDAQQLRQVGSDAAELASTAWKALRDIDVSAMVRDRGLDELSVVYILDSQKKLLIALKLYEQAGQLVAQAASAQGAQRDALAERARGVFDAANALFDDGYTDLSQARAKAGVLEAPAPGSQPLAPTGTT